MTTSETCFAVTLADMGLVTCQLAVSLDGYLAGPNQSLENPLGEGGPRLHGWHFAPTEPTSPRREVLDGNGAYILGRKMFGGGTAVTGTSIGRAGGAKIRRITHRRSS